MSLLFHEKFRSLLSYTVVCIVLGIEMVHWSSTRNVTLNLCPVGLSITCQTGCLGLGVMIRIQTHEFSNKMDNLCNLLYIRSSFDFHILF